MTELKRSVRRGNKSVADIVGRIVRIPASMYGIDVPGMMYRAKVIKKDTSHKNAVVLSFFEDDGSLHWAPADDVRKWLAYHGEGRCTGEDSDRYAVDTLLQFRGMSRNSMKDENPAERWSNDHEAPPSSSSGHDIADGNDEMDIDAVKVIRPRAKQPSMNRNLIWKDFPHGIVPKGTRSVKSRGSIMGRKHLHQGVQKSLAVVLDKNC